MLAVAGAAWAWRLLERRGPDVPAGVMESTVRSGVLLGAVGFLGGGVLGPLIFAPEANLGPLLGIFITGPIGFVLGALGGFVYGLGQPAGRRPARVTGGRERGPSAGIQRCSGALRLGNGE